MRTNNAKEPHNRTGAVTHSLARLIVYNAMNIKMVYGITVSIVCGIKRLSIATACGYTFESCCPATVDVAGLLEEITTKRLVVYGNGTIQ